MLHFLSLKSKKRKSFSCTPTFISEREVSRIKRIAPHILKAEVSVL